MRALIRLALWATIALAGSALAEPTSLNETFAGYTYFYKPGATMRTHDADVAVCQMLALPTVQPGRAAAEAATDPYSSAGFWERMENAGQAQSRLGRDVNLENCMVAKGWRVVSVDPASGAALLAESRSDRLAKIAGWVGDEAPHGVVVRTFDNEALYAATPVFAAAQPRGQRLDVDPESPPTPQFVQLDPDDPTANSTEPYSVHRVKPLRPETIRPPGPDSGLIAISMGGSGSFRLVFERVDAHGRQVSDGETDDFTVAQSQPDTAGQVRVYAVPAGHWRIAAMAQGPYLVNFCLGAPDFYLAPSQVIYAGAFDPLAPTRAPNMDLAAGKAAFPQGSRLAETLRPADWRNGSVGRCRGAYLYALEFPGRPFAEDYHMGSMAQTSAP